MFAVHTIGPALVLKRFPPVLAMDGRAVLAALSARVGNIGHNKLVGWYSYRAAKAALEVRPNLAAARLLGVIAVLAPEDSGECFNHHGKPVPR